VRQGDLVIIKEFYRLDITNTSSGIILDLYEDADGCLWFKTSHRSSEGYMWRPDYEFEVISEM
jgi:ligand-binding sensor domain-containing protein